MRKHENKISKLFKQINQEQNLKIPTIRISRISLLQLITI